MDINWTSQLLAALSSLVIGYVWYGLLFDKQWQLASGISEEQIKKGPHPGLLYGASFVLAFVITIGLKGQIVDIHEAFAKLNEKPFTNSFQHGAFHGFLDSIFFGAVSVLVTNSLYDQRNWKYILINVGYWMLTFTIMGGIIGSFGNQ